jgi:hypothetical protein
MMVARQLGWPLIPWPTDYLTRPRWRIRPLPDYLDVAGNLLRADMALHEEIGLAAYRLRGQGEAKGGATAATASNAPPSNVTRASALSNAPSNAGNGTSAP